MKEQTIAQQLGITEFPFRIKDKNGNEIYFEDHNGYWNKKEINSHSNLTYYVNSFDQWVKWEYDSGENIIYCEDSSGCWWRQEFDSRGNRIYYESSWEGVVIDNRPIHVMDLKDGEIGKIVDGTWEQYNGMIVQRFYDNLVSLGKGGCRGWSKIFHYEEMIRQINPNWKVVRKELGEVFKD